MYADLKEKAWKSVFESGLKASKMNCNMQEFGHRESRNSCKSRRTCIPIFLPNEYATSKTKIWQFSKSVNTKQNIYPILLWREQQQERFRNPKSTENPDNLHLCSWQSRQLGKLYYFRNKFLVEKLNGSTDRTFLKDFIDDGMLSQHWKQKLVLDIVRHAIG